MRETHRDSYIKKIVLIALLFAVLLFLFAERDSLRNEKREHINETYENFPTHTVSLEGSHIIEQKVTMRTDSIQTIHIYFLNPSGSNSKGELTLELTDDKGNAVAETFVDASLVNRNKYTKLEFGVDAASINTNRIVSTRTSEKDKGKLDVKKGATYTFRLTTENISCEEPLEVVLSEYKDSGKPNPHSVVIDGKERDSNCLYMAITERTYSYKTIALFLFLILATLIFTIFPFDKIDTRIENRTGKENLFSRACVISMFVLSPMAAYFVIQKFVGYGLMSFLRHITDASGKGFANLVIIGLVWWALYTISGRMRFTSMMTVLLAAGFGLTNYALIMFRDTPLIATDFAQLGTALQVADTYTLYFDKSFLWAVLVTALWGVAAFAPQENLKRPDLKHRVIHVLILLVWIGSFYYMFFSSSYVKDHRFKVSGFKPKGSYTVNGCALSFVITVKNSIVRKPQNYDLEAVSKIVESYPSDKAIEVKKVSAETPNVIIVMNESFSDLSVLGSIKTNQEVIPFYNGIKENAVKGWLHSSVFGGSTANSEFECLTGFTMKYMPFMSVPYRSVIKEPTPSLAEYMSDLGYGGIIAFHPGMINSYNRDKIYPLLGFKKHIAFDHLKEPVKIRDYVSDEYDYNCVMKEFESFRKDSNEPFFMFNVTIQNHGGYGLETGKVDAGIEVLSQDNNQDSVVQFLNLMKLSDDALKQLLDYFSKIDEETIIVLFGDHQPKLAEEFYSVMRGKNSELSDIEWADLRHQVPFMIWANYDIEERSDVRISANYIGPYLKSIIGLPMTGFDKYLMEMNKQLPVINAISFDDNTGKTYSPDDVSEYDEKLEEYSIVQYNGLIDIKNRINEFYTLKK